MAENDAVMEFTLDERYLREFHREWVAARGRGWRFERVMIPSFGIAALFVTVTGVLKGVPGLLYLSGVMFLISIFEGWRRVRRRRIWLSHCRTLPWYGKSVKIVLRGRELVQENEIEGDPRFERTGEILTTPNGYLVRYMARERIELPAPISDVDASIYIPHRVITPPMTKADFTRRISVPR